MLAKTVPLLTLWLCRAHCQSFHPSFCCFDLFWIILFHLWSQEFLTISHEFKPLDVLWPIFLHCIKLVSCVQSLPQFSANRLIPELPQILGLQQLNFADPTFVTKLLYTVGSNQCNSTGVTQMNKLCNSITIERDKDLTTTSNYVTA